MRGDSSPRPLTETSVRIRRALAGHRTDLDWVVGHLGPLLEAQARYRMPPSRRDEVDDIVHEVWLDALPRLGDLRAREGRYTPVLIRYLSKTLLHRVRRRTSGAPRPATLQEPTAATPPETVVREASLGEVHRRIREGIDQLGERDREVLVLRGVEQWANREVAEITGEPANTVAVRYRRALGRLRERVPHSLLDELLT